MKPRLEDWTLLGNGSLHGKVYGNPRFEDGEYIITSLVQSLDLEGKKAQTRNTEYELGEPATHTDTYYAKEQE